MKNISIFEDRASIELTDGTIIQFVIWDLEKSQHEFLELQFKLAFGLGMNFKDIENHMRMNGFDVKLEDIN